MWNPEKFRKVLNIVVQEGTIIGLNKKVTTKEQIYEALGPKLGLEPGTVKRWSNPKSNGPGDNAYIVELEKEVAEANKAAEKSKRDYETIKQAVLSKDAVLYKQCLLYPLEQRYKPDLIDDALGTVSAFAELGQMSEKFQEYKNTYEPLLKQYGQYNQQLLDYLLSRIEYIEVREKKLGEGRQIPIPDNWMKELKDLPYYQECYIGKDTPPYKSIIYLDDVIDEIKNAIEQNSN